MTGYSLYVHTCTKHRQKKKKLKEKIILSYPTGGVVLPSICPSSTSLSFSNSFMILSMRPIIRFTRRDRCLLALDSSTSFSRPVFESSFFISSRSWQNQNKVWVLGREHFKQTWLFFSINSITHLCHSTINQKEHRLLWESVKLIIIFFFPMDTHIELPQHV